MTTSFSIPARIPSNNKLLRMHWANRARLIKEWKNFVSLFGKIDSVDGHCNIKVIEIVPKGGRRLDEINLLAAADKLIIDAMVKLKILKNDSPKYLHVEAGNEAGRYWGVRIEVTITETATRPTRKSVSAQGRVRVAKV